MIMLILVKHVKLHLDLIILVQLALDVQQTVLFAVALMELLVIDACLILEELWFKMVLLYVKDAHLIA